MLTETQYNRLQTLVKASSRAWFAADYIMRLHSLNGEPDYWHYKHTVLVRQAVKTGQALMRLMRVQRNTVKPVCKDCNGEGFRSCITPNCGLCPQACHKCNRAAYNMGL